MKKLMKKHCFFIKISEIDLDPARKNTKKSRFLDFFSEAEIFRRWSTNLAQPEKLQILQFFDSTFCEKSLPMAYKNEQKSLADGLIEKCVPLFARF